MVIGCISEEGNVLCRYKAGIELQLGTGHALCEVVCVCVCVFEFRDQLMQANMRRGSCG